MRRFARLARQQATNEYCSHRIDARRTRLQEAKLTLAAFAENSILYCGRPGIEKR